MKEKKESDRRENNQEENNVQSKVQNKEPNKLTNTRHRRILDQLRHDGVIKVEELSNSLSVASITIRRDLDFLQGQGLLERIHGGALPLKNQQMELPYTTREHIQTEEKEAIGRCAAELVQDQAIVFINSGSTALQVLRNLLYKRVQVISNNVDSVQLLNRAKSIPTLELMVLGGQYRYQSHSLFGDMAFAAIANIYSSYTILGINGIHPEYGVTSSWYQHASLHKKMIENCKGKVIVVADSSKIDVISNFVCAEVQAIDILVTDGAVKPQSLQHFAELGLQVIVAK